MGFGIFKLVFGVERIVVLIILIGMVSVRGVFFIFRILGCFVDFLVGGRIYFFFDERR